MNEREHAVLSLFYEEGHREITPSLLAYRMRMSTGDATKVLDGMVKKDLLNLHVDDEGHISYRLPPSERHRIGERASNQQPNRWPDEGSQADEQPQADGFYAASSASADQNRGPDGTDAAVGPSASSPNHAAQTGAGHRRAGPDGTDGSLGPTGPVNRSKPQHHAPAPHRQPGHSHQPPRGEHRYNDPSRGESPRGRVRTDGPTPRDRSGGDWPPPGSQVDSSGPAQGYPHHAQTGTQTAGRRRSDPVTQPPAHQPPSTPRSRQLARTSGSQSRSIRKQRPPIVAGALSLLVPGLGQFYNGEISKGVMLLFSYVFLILFWLFWIVHIWSIIDAYMVADEKNRRSLNDESDQPQRPLLTEQPQQPSNPNSTAA